MMKHVLVILLMSFSNCFLYCQGLYNNGANIVVSGSATLYIEGGTNGDYRSNGASAELDLQNAPSTLMIEGDINNSTGTGAFTGDYSGVVEFVGIANQTIGGTGTTTFENVEISKPSGDVDLGASSNLTNIFGSLTLTSGTVDLNDDVLNLGSTGEVVSETNSNRIYDSGTSDGSGGYVQFGPINLNTNSTVYSSSDFGNLGLEITTGAGNVPGNTTIKRFHDSEVMGSSNSINRQFDISPSTNTSLDATLKVSYLDNEMHGVEANYKFFRSEDNGVSWSYARENSSVNSTSNYVEEAGIESFSLWAISDEVNDPLPVDFIDMVGVCERDTIQLQWSTTAEVENDGFLIEASHDGTNYMEKGFVRGIGNSSEVNQYHFSFPIESSSPLYVNLIQMDNNGEKSLLSKRYIYPCDDSDQLEDINVYVFRGELNFELDLNEDFDYVIDLFDSQGQIIHHSQKRLISGFNSFGLPVDDFATGIYYVRMTRAGNLFTKPVFID